MHMVQYVLDADRYVCCAVQAQEVAQLSINARESFNVASRRLEAVR